MAPNADPWRILGLSPGATEDEIRRAYRRLAKVNHPDAAGEAALPRFLAIQSAYEQLAAPGRLRRIGGRPAARSTSGADQPPGSPREPWRADPDRARASGRADGRRAPGARPSGASGSSARRPRNAPGAGPGGGSAGPAAAGDGPRAAGADPASAGGKRRSRKAAGPGSTSYEGADKEPFEPGWSGATWYGASSGTYWTINPKEYADPRKHGPEYQARARRARGESPDETRDAEDPTEMGPSTTSAQSAAQGAEPAEPAEPAERADPHASRPGRRPPDRGPRTRPVGSAAPAGGPDPADPPAPGGSRHDPGERPGGAWREAASRGTTPTARPTAFDPSAWLETTADAGGFHGPLLRHPTTPTGRLAMALLGWPPLGLFAAAAIGETSGCGRYAAACAEASAPGTWVLQVAIVMLLLAVPRVAFWSAHGAIAAVVIGVPTSVVLSAAGGTNVRDASAPVLIAVLAVAYLLGVAYAVLVRRRSVTT